MQSRTLDDEPRRHLNPRGLTSPQLEVPTTRTDIHSAGTFNIGESAIQKLNTEHLEQENNNLKEQVSSLYRCMENRELELQAARSVVSTY